MSTKNTKRHWRFGLTAMLAVVLVWAGPNGILLAQDTNSPADPVADLNQQINDKKRALDELAQQKAALQQAVDQASSQVHDIKSQIALIDAQLAQSNFAINEKQSEIGTLELEMLQIQQSVDRKNEEINAKKKQLADAIRQIDANTRVSTLALVLTQDNFADFYGQAQAITALSTNLQSNILAVNTLRDELTAKQDTLVKTRDDIRQSKLQLEVQRNGVVDQREYKDELLDSAQDTQSQYNDLLAQAAKEEQQANATISALEQQIQARLNGDTNADQPVFNSKGYIWPAGSGSIITAYFHDPTYPFKRYIGEHTGLDIGVHQGTPVRATADGIVSVVHSQGFYTDSAGRKTKSALNFVGIVHDKGISSRYLHLSAIYVRADQFVRQGEIIGLSGGLPGTAGAGTTTTGAHLHFEVRVDGIPDDPLKYLP